MKYDEVKAEGWLTVPGKDREARLKTVPVELDAIADVALNYRPKNKATKLKPRKRRKAR